MDALVGGTCQSNIPVLSRKTKGHIYRGQLLRSYRSGTTLTRRAIKAATFKSLHGEGTTWSSLGAQQINISST